MRSASTRVSERRPVRILHLPSNIASIPSHTVRAQRRLGLDARGLEYALKGSWVVDMQCIERRVIPTNFRSFSGIACIADYARQVAWADVVHWYFSTRFLPRELDFRILRWADKPHLVEWMGSDIRDPVSEASDNAVFAQGIDDGTLSGIWSPERAAQSQHDFAEAGFVPVAAPGMVQYVLPEYRSHLRVIDRAVILDDYAPRSNPGPREPLVVAHAPSRMQIKGTSAVMGAVEKVREHCSFEFDLIHDVPRTEAIQRIRRADVFIDQLVLGDYGMASIEAMALGVPCICYIKPSLIQAYPGLPIANATPDSLSDVLLALLKDGKRRDEMRHAGLAYVRARHDAMKRAIALRDIYAELVAHIHI